MKPLAWIFHMALIAMLLTAGPSFGEDDHTYGTFVLFSVAQDWASQAPDMKKDASQQFGKVVESFKDRVTVDTYWTYGLTTSSHFLLRLHSTEMTDNQALLTRLMNTGLGRYLTITFTISGVTKALNYAPDFPALLDQLKGAKYEASPPRYAIMIPTRKDSKWWNLAREDRVAMMKEHTVATLPYLKTVKRKLYHATGLSDADFITIFETDRLVDFNNLVIALRMVREDQHNIRLGLPTALGTIKPMSEVLDLLNQ